MTNIIKEMTNTTICPNCQHEFNEDLERTKRAEEAAKNKWKQKNEETIAMQKSLQEMKNKEEADFQSKLIRATQDSEEKLKEQFKKDFVKEALRLKDESDRKNKQEIDKEVQRISAERELEKIKAIQAAENKVKSDYELKLKEKDILLNQQKAANEKQRQQLSQGSMQLQGEALEQVVKEWLINAFTADDIQDINNGANGADIVQKVVYQNTQVGTILFECKRTKSYSNSWLPKLKDEMRELNVDAGVLITQAMPKDEVVIEARKYAIVICTPETFKFAIPFMREAMCKTYKFNKIGAHQKSAGELLIKHLCSKEFTHQFRALVDLYHKRKDANKKAQDWIYKYFNVQAQDSEKLSSLIYDTFQGLQRASGESIPEIPGLEYSLKINDIEEV